MKPVTALASFFHVNIESAPLAFGFSGSGADYFRIWIVNLLPTLATLGIYSAWAMTRRLRYFYRNTNLAGASFDFRGDPKAILRGRIPAAADEEEAERLGGKDLDAVPPREKP